MNKETKSNNEYPDISGVFDIDEDKIPKEIIKKDPDTPEITNRFLTADEAARFLPKKEQKNLEKEKKTEKRKIKRDKRRVRLIIILAAVITALVIGAVVRTSIEESKKTVISVEKPVVQTISRYTLSKGITFIQDGTLQAVFIDNDYDVHYIEAGQPTELTDENGTAVTGKIAAIKEVSPDSPLLEKYYEQLLPSKPSTSCYAVYVSLDTADSLKKEGIPLSVKVITKSSENALTVKSESVFIDGNQPYVWVYSSMKRTLTKTDVRTGLTSDGRTEITAGLEKSDKVMQNSSCPPEALYDGIEVKTN